MTIGETAAMIMAGVAIASQVYQWWRGRSESKRDNGDAAESVANATTTLIEPLNKRIKDLERTVGEQKTQIETMTRAMQAQQFEITELRAGVAILTNQIMALGHQPIYKPSPRGGNEAAA